MALKANRGGHGKDIKEKKKGWKNDVETTYTSVNSIFPNMPPEEIRGVEATSKASESDYLDASYETPAYFDSSNDFLDEDESHRNSIGGHDEVDGHELHSKSAHGSEFQGSAAEQWEHSSSQHLHEEDVATPMWSQHLSMTFDEEPYGYGGPNLYPEPVNEHFDLQLPIPAGPRGGTFINDDPRRKLAAGSPSVTKPSTPRSLGLGGALSGMADEIKQTTKLRRSEVEPVDKRTMLNVLERARREDLKSSFQSLRDIVPDLEGDLRAVKGMILIKASEYIQYLNEEAVNLENTVQTLRSENHRLKVMMSTHEPSPVDIKASSDQSTRVLGTSRVKK